MGAALTATPYHRRNMAIWRAFNCLPALFYQRLNTLIDDPEAWAVMPRQIARLERLREARRAAR